MDDRIVFSGDLRAVLQQTVAIWTPALICFNGKRAASEALRLRRPSFGLQADSIGPAQVFVAPSTSGAANGTWDAQHWHALARLVLPS
ncbi:MAG: hypothetical protein ACR2GK_07405 [Gemmatimonadaceae bacterium]